MATGAWEEVSLEMTCRERGSQGGDFMASGGLAWEIIHFYGVLLVPSESLGHVIFMGKGHRCHLSMGKWSENLQTCLKPP